MDVTMPQLGETVTEGTITRWMKQVGEHVDVDEPLFEVSTDKVDSEVPSPTSGVLSEILVAEGDTVAVGTRLAVLAAEEGAAGAGAPERPASPAPVSSTVPVAPPPPPAPAQPPAPTPAAPAVSAPAASPLEGGGSSGGAGGVVTSPVVRRLLEEYGVNAAQIRGTGDGGRITRSDVLAFVESRRGASPAPVVPPSSLPSAAPAPPVPRVARGDEVIPFDSIRRLTAEHMVRSKATSAHVYTSVEVDFERVEHVREVHRDEWKAAEGFSLTYLPFVLRATCDAITEFPSVNASVDGQSLVVHHDVHVGVAVDLGFRGLIAPVIRDAGGKRLRMLAGEVSDVASRARDKKLLPDEVLGGTFTVTNPGPFGSYITLPIINQPQVAILSTDGVAKRPVVVEGPDGDDAIAIHPMGILALAWDHRAFDGAYASAFLRRIKEIIEHRDWEPELA